MDTGLTLAACVIVWMLGKMRGERNAKTFLSGRCEAHLTKARAEWQSRKIGDHEYFGKIETLRDVRKDIAISA